MRLIILIPIIYKATSEKGNEFRAGIHQKSFPYF